MANSQDIDPIAVLKKLKKELTEVSANLDQTLKNASLSENDVDGAIDYLNATIRQLDRAVENLIESKNNFLA